MFSSNSERCCWFKSKTAGETKRVDVWRRKGRGGKKKTEERRNRRTSWRHEGLQVKPGIDWDLKAAKWPNPHLSLQISLCIQGKQTLNSTVIRLCATICDCIAAVKSKRWYNKGWQIQIVQTNLGIRPFLWAEVSGVYNYSKLSCCLSPSPRPP